MAPKLNFRDTGLTLAAGALSLAAGAASADQVINDDLIVIGSACVGQDCVNGESFGFDTLRLKENNLRIKAQDTSSSASFPTVDWQLTFNDSSNGGANKFSVDEVDSGTTPFTILAGAGNNALFVDAQGDVGLNNSNPVVELHITDGDSPTVRLEQNGSSGFAAQTWDLAGNETNFFVRDVTNGSKLPFKIFPNAPNNALTIEGATGDIGMGTTSPDAALDIEGTDAGARVNNTNAANAGRTLLELTNLGNPEILMENRNISDSWALSAGNNFLIKDIDPGGNTNVFTLTEAGDLTITGTLTTGSNTNYPDYVFAPDYELMPLAEVDAFIVANGHLPRIPTAEQVAVTGLNITEMQVALLEKVEELTLYTLEQQKTIDTLQQRLDALSD
ncbi:MAG: hypothetical protein LJE68_06300 [Rhodobacter sp.]|jgi:hypothetical protein|nr:hypothetical protein [Rhodobacter sp.]